jgi:HEAT repeat protein
MPETPFADSLGSLWWRGSYWQLNVPSARVREGYAKKGFYPSYPWRPWFMFTFLKVVRLCRRLTKGPEREAAAKELGSLGNRRALGPLVRALADPNEWVRAAVASALGELGDARAVDPLIQALSDRGHFGGNYVRAKAAESLGMLGNTRAFEPLVQTLTDEKWEVRGAAAAALGQLKDLRAVEPLVKLLTDKPYSAEDAASALGELRDVRAVEPLINLLGDESDKTRRCAAQALAKLGQTKWEAGVKGTEADFIFLGACGDERFVTSLIRVLGNQSRIDRRRAAVTGLVKTHDPRAVEPLIRALDDADLDIRKLAAEGLGKLRDRRAVEPLIQVLAPGEHHNVAAAASLGKLKDSRAIAPLIRCLARSRELRRLAAEALSELGDAKWAAWIKGDIDDIGRLVAAGESDLCEILGSALADRKSETRAEVAKALGELQDPRAVDLLIKALEAGSDGYVTDNGITFALAKQNDSRAVEPLIKALAARDAFVRHSAADVLGLLKAPRAVEPLIKALLDPDENVRASAALALGKLKDLRVVELLIKALLDSEEVVRSCSAQALRELKDLRAVEPLIKALLDSEKYVRSAAARALGELKDLRAVEPLIKALLDSEKYVRSAAARALGELKDLRAVEALIKALLDPEKDVRSLAASALAKIEPAQPWQTWVKGDDGDLMRLQESSDQRDVTLIRLQQPTPVPSDKAMGAQIMLNPEDPATTIRQFVSSCRHGKVLLDLLTKLGFDEISFDPDCRRKRSLGAYMNKYQATGSPGTVFVVAVGEDDERVIHITYTEAVSGTEEVLFSDLS